MVSLGFQLINMSMVMTVDLRDEGKTVSRVSVN